MIHIRDNIYIEIYYELASETVWNVLQDQWVIYVNKNDSIERVMEKGLEFIIARGGCVWQVEFPHLHPPF